MKNHVYKVLEIVGSSQTSIEDAIKTAIELAGKTVRNMDWFEVVETRGHIKDGKAFKRRTVSVYMERKRE